MLAAFATAAFLAALWLIGLIAVRAFSESGGKMLAALQGRSVLAATPAAPPVAMRVSPRSRLQQTLHAQPQWRAAA